MLTIPLALSLTLSGACALVIDHPVARAPEITSSTTTLGEMSAVSTTTLTQVEATSIPSGVSSNHDDLTSTLGPQPTTTSSVSATAASSSTAAATLPTSLASDKLIVAHFIVGNSYPYTHVDWVRDFQLASSKGIDGFAMNVGSDSWQTDRVADAYAAAALTNFKLFFSFDMTVIPCSGASDIALIQSYIGKYAAHPAQLLFRSRALVSTFSGESCTFGTNSINAGWTAAVRAGPSVFFMPSFFVDPVMLGSYAVLDGDYSWDGSWPKSALDLAFDLDARHISGNSKRAFMAAVSPWFYTHYSFKNWFYGGDGWLLATRFEQLLAHRAQVDIIQVISWNDYGESHYVGPIEGAQPNSQAWVDGFDHTAWLDMVKVYATAFKTGTFPTLAKDQVFMWSRPHPASALILSDALGKPLGWNWTSDYLWAVVFNAAPAILTLSSGANNQTFALGVGVAKVKIPSAPGAIRATLARGGVTVVDVVPGGFNYTTTPATYNYNAFVAGGSSP